MQDSSSSNDKYNECVGIAKILKINERASTLFKHLRVVSSQICVSSGDALKMGLLRSFSHLRGNQF